MIAKKGRTLDMYKKAGSETRLFKSLAAKLVMDISPILTSRETDRLLKALDTVNLICSRTEEHMFSDYPTLSNEYLDVFCGNVGDETRNKVDAQIVLMAKEAADELFRETD